MRLLTFFIAAILVSSCADFNRPKQLERIDDLLTSIDSLSGVCGTFASDSLMIRQKNILALNEIISDRFSGDTVDIELAIKLEDFATVRDDIDYIVNELPVVGKSLVDVRGSLSKLRKDVDAGNGKRDKYNEYIAGERKKVDKVTNAVTELTNLKNKSISTYLDLYEELHKLTLSKPEENLE